MRSSPMLLVLILTHSAACDDEVTSTEPAVLPSFSIEAATTADAGPRYSIQVLDVEVELEPDERIGVAGYVNNRGEVTAQLFRDTDLGPRAAGVALWDSEAGTVRAIELAGLVGLPFINDAGQLAGSWRASSSSVEPFLWTPGAGLEPLGFAGRAGGIGSGGEVVGRRFTDASPSGEAFHWTPASGLRVLDTPAGESSEATGVNDAGVVVGSAGAQAIAWNGGTAAVLPNPDGISTFATDLNDRNAIVGVHFSGVGETTGILWPAPDAEPVLLPCTPPAFQECRANDINDRGEILGHYGNDEAEFPMIWVDGQAYDLKQRIEGEHVPPIIFALGLNDRGQIAGYAHDAGSDGGFVVFPFILTPMSDARTVRIDVKPNSDPNSFNLDGNGTIPVAVLGDAELEPSHIDPGTLELNGLVITHRGNGSPRCETEDVDGDGYADLVCHFDDDLSRWTGPDDVATLTGALFDGTAIEGSDAIRLTQ